jgi:pSer/pThr/pTyr-binding forkhead associated (FHA) protein
MPLIILMLHLEIIEAAGRRVVVVNETASYMVGRSSECQLQLPDAQVSRKHCEFAFANGGWRGRRKSGWPTRRPARRALPRSTSVR